VRSSRSVFAPSPGSVRSSRHVLPVETSRDPGGMLTSQAIGTVCVLTRGRWLLVMSGMAVQGAAPQRQSKYSQ
jgi:hypothetical protein